MVRPPCCDKLSAKRCVWTAAEEDAKILGYESKHGNGNPTAIHEKTGVRRCGKSCKLRWNNYLRPNLKHESFTPQEEEMIVRLHAAIGSRWSIIAQQLPGRTDNDVKNYWNSKLRKKLTEMGIDPVTHKPFSQILADYGNIGAFPKSRIAGSLKNAFLLQSQAAPKTDLVLIQNDNKSTNSTELLAQLQAIKLVTQASTNYNCNYNTMYVFGETSSSSCSSSSAAAAAPATAAAFSWRDFLLEDPFLPADISGPQEQGEEQYLVSESSSQCPNETLESEVEEWNGNGCFVETMLKQDNQMMPEFPQLLDDPFFF